MLLKLIKHFFRLLESYPFSCNDSVRDFGIIPGTISAYKNKQSGDVDIESNQVLMKFFVRIDENSPEGEKIIHLEAIPDKSSVNTLTYDLPIDVRNVNEKTTCLTDSELQNICKANSNQNYLNWVFGIIGLITGAFIIILLVLIAQKRRAHKHH